MSDCQMTVDAKDHAQIFSHWTFTRKSGNDNSRPCRHDLSACINNKGDSNLKLHKNVDKCHQNDGRNSKANMVDDIVRITELKYALKT